MNENKTVSIEVLKQVMWERDAAIEQLEEYGVGFGEKKKDLVEVVRCGQCARRNKSADLTDTVLCYWLHNLSMPKNGFCNYGEREQNE